MKCGIVFSKYYALFPSESSAANGLEESIAPAPPSMEQDRGSVLSDLQLQVRELCARFAEVEFEKAERHQLRADLRNLERQLQDNLKRMSAQLGNLEKRFDEPSAPIAQQEHGVHLPALLERLGQIENRLERLDHINRKISDLDGKNGTNSQLVSDLQAQHSILREEITAIKSQLELVRQIHENQEPATPLEADIHAIRKNLDVFYELLSKHISS
jgi:phage shock protein A